MESLTFMSYNSTGLDSAKVSFSLDICDSYDVDFLSFQEHFKFVNVDKFFKSGFKDFSSFVVAGQMTGRAKAGLAQLCRKDYEIKKVRVSTNGLRLQAQVLELATTRVLLLNTYFPTDPKQQHYDDGELQEVLEEIRIS